MPKLDLRNAIRIKAAGGELRSLKGAGFSWTRPAASFDPAFLTNTAIDIFHDYSNLGAMTAGDGGPVVQGDNDTMARVINLRNPGTFDRVQASEPNRPRFDNGPVYDGVDDWMETQFPVGTGPANHSHFFLIKTTDPQFMLGGTNSTSVFAGAAQSGNGTAASQNVPFVTYTADLVPTASSTRGGLDDEWATGEWVLAGIMTADYEIAGVSSFRDNYAAAGFPFTGKAMYLGRALASDPGYDAALALFLGERNRLVGVFGP